jgi:casein kinase II subunit alpha
LIKIAKVIGTQDVLEYVDRFNLKLDPQISEKMQNFKKKPWDKFVSSLNSHLLSEPEPRDAVFDLLTRMLTIDHTNRITAREAINH